jgi:hypothetical protein
MGFSGPTIGRDADHVHVGMHVNAGRMGVENGQHGRFLAGRPRRTLGRRLGLGCIRLGRFGFGRRTLALAHGVGYLDGRRAKTAGVGQEGNRSIAVSPTGSTHRTKSMRVANDRVAASRARLTYGHEAPGFERPRTLARCSTLKQNTNRENPRPKFTGRRGAARGAEVNLTPFLFPISSSSYLRTLVSMARQGHASRQELHFTVG